MKIKLISFFAALSLLVGCTTTPQAQAPKAEEKNISSVRAKEVETLMIYASDDVYVLVKTRNTNEQLYRNTMQAGENTTLEVEDAVDVFFTRGEHLIFEWKGERLRPSSKGTAKITFN